MRLVRRTPILRFENWLRFTLKSEKRIHSVASYRQDKFAQGLRFIQIEESERIEHPGAKASQNRNPEERKHQERF